MNPHVLLIIIIISGLLLAKTRFPEFGAHQTHKREHWPVRMYHIRKKHNVVKFLLATGFDRKKVKRIGNFVVPSAVNFCCGERLVQQKKSVSVNRRVRKLVEFEWQWPEAVGLFFVIFYTVCGIEGMYIVTCFFKFYMLSNSGSKKISPLFQVALLSIIKVGLVISPIYLLPKLIAFLLCIRRASPEFPEFMTFQVFSPGYLHLHIYCVLISNRKSN